MNPEVLPEQFIPDHVFVYFVKGGLHCSDGDRHQQLIPGNYYLFRKNHLIKYHRDKGDNEIEFIRICFEEEYLKAFQQKHKTSVAQFNSPRSFINITLNELIPDFIRSLKLIYHHGDIDEPFTDVKQEELLIILLQEQPELAGIFFDFGQPEKINLE